MPNREIRNVRQGKVSKISKEQLNNINPKTEKSHGGSVDGRSQIGGNRPFKKGGKACGK